MNQNPNFDFYSFPSPQDKQEQSRSADQVPSADASHAPNAPIASVTPQNAPPVRPDKDRMRLARRAFSRVGLAVLVMIIVWYAAALILQTPAAALMPELLQTSWFSFVSGTIPLYIFGIPALLLVLIGLPAEAPQKCRFGAGRLTIALFVAFGLGIVGNIVGNLFTTVITFLSGYSFSNMLETTFEMPMWLTVLAVAVLAPIFEELIFRKILIDRLLPYGEFGAIMISALLFGLIHGNFYQFFYATALGALMAYLYVRSGKLWLSVLIHALFNLSLSVVPILLMDWLDYDTLLSLADNPEQLFSFLFDHFNAFFSLAFYYLMLYSLAAVGIILLIVFRKKLTLKAREGDIPRGFRASAAFGNAGMIMLLLLCAGIFVLNMIATATPLL